LALAFAFAKAEQRPPGSPFLERASRRALTNPAVMAVGKNKRMSKGKKGGKKKA
jgi:hypothetical protein